LPEPNTSCDSGGGTGCSIEGALDAGETPEPVSIRTIIEAEDGFSMVAEGEVVLESGLVVADGEPLYVGDVVIEGVARNDGDGMIWATDENGDECAIPPGAMLTP
jgi:hypothetical protein